MINDKPRVRFAPSPTGYLHVGGLRTALYNYLFARKNDGEIILRIEDTDRSRFVEGALEGLLTAFKWAGIEFDEGPDKGGNYGPYMQSQRLDIYAKYALQLIKSGKAYYAFDTPERLEELRAELSAKKMQPKYDKHDLYLSEEQIREKLESGVPHVIRLNVEPGSKVVFEDVIRGKVEFDRDTIDDQILIKSDGFPTYHLANVVDDHLMKITHVIRGEEWLSSTPKHVLLYDYFGWEEPVFAHLPLLLNPDKSKLSKRQGDVAVEDYKDKGYLKEALLNFVALLGWSPGENLEYMNIEDMIANFELGKVHKAGAVFNLEKLNWLNSEHIKRKDKETLLEMLKNEMQYHAYNASDYNEDYLLKVADVMKDRCVFIRDYFERSPYFFKAPDSYDPDVKEKRWKENSSEYILKLADTYENGVGGDKEFFELNLKKTAESLGVGAGQLIHPVRLAVSGIGVGPGLYEILEILGKNEVVKRIRTAAEKLK